MKTLITILLAIFIIAQLILIAWIGYLKFTVGIDQTITRFFLNYWELYLVFFLITISILILSFFNNEII